MAERSGYEHGVFNWVDLCTGDTDAAKVFYSALFGWSFADDLKDGELVYSVGLKNERPVVGLLPQPAELSEMGVPYFWETYIKVDDVEAALAGVAEAGGTPMGPVVDVDSGAGRFVVVSDPTGGVVMLWEPVNHNGAELVNEHGTVCWNELLTSDVDAAFGFYTRLLGWTPVSMGEGALRGIRQGEEIIGTVSPTPPGVPSHWTVYFAVDDCDATVVQCVRLGGQVIVPAMDQPPGRMAQLADDQGAMFWVIDLSEQFSMS